MRKHFFSLLALLVTAQIIWAVTAPADIPAYYADVNGQSGTSLFDAIHTVAKKGYSSLSYSGLWGAYQTTDVYPADSTGKAGHIWDMYSNCDFIYSSDQCGSYSRECDCYNREHSIPKSWFGGSESKSTPGTDLFHVVPTDGKVNGTRGNLAFGEVNVANYTYDGCKRGTPLAITISRSMLGEGDVQKSCSGTVFEPASKYKGDFARGYLGMLLRWNSDYQAFTSDDGSKIFSGNYTQAGHWGLTEYGLALLLKWHREDPVSQKEIDRNNGIQTKQGNRNPFIDYPYLAEFIWGEKAGETVDLSMLMPSTDPDFVPGLSNGWRGSDTPPVPPTPETKYGVTWMVNGEELRTDSVISGERIADMPDEPESCSTESDTFVGWTPVPVSGTMDEEPLLFKTLDDFPLIVTDVTYYAVFAHAEESGSSEPATYIFDADNQEGWLNTATNKGSYWLLETGKTIVSPEIDLMGLEKIKVRMRTYGGTNYNRLDIFEADGQLASITATGGSTMTEYEWVNNLYIAGISALTFSSDYGANKGIGIASITIDATGSAITYSRYITSCQGTTEIELVPAATSRKVLIGGQIYILLGEHLYTVFGQEVR